jgi:hypothetical protein
MLHFLARLASQFAPEPKLLAKAKNTIIEALDRPML